MADLRVTIRCEAVRGVLKITQESGEDSVYNVQATNYLPFHVEGNSLGEVIDKTLANLHQLKRSPEFKARQRIKAEQMRATRERNGTSVGRPKGAGKSKPKLKQHDNGTASRSDINLSDEEAKQAIAS